MKDNPLYWCFLSALFSGTWPLIAKFYKLNSFWMAVIMPIGTLVVAVLWLSANPQPIPQTKQVLIALACGLIGGISFVIFTKLISWPNKDISVLISIVTASGLTVLAIGAWLIFGESFTTKKILGLIAIFIGIYLIR